MVVNPSSGSIRCVEVEDGALYIRFDGGSSFRISPQDCIDVEDMLPMLSRLRDAAEYLTSEIEQGVPKPCAVFCSSVTNDIAPF